jgi:hypothetical protein
MLPAQCKSSEQRGTIVPKSTRGRPSLVFLILKNRNDKMHSTRAKRLRVEHVIFEQFHKIAVTSVRPPDTRDKKSASFSGCN